MFTLRTILREARPLDGTSARSVDELVDETIQLLAQAAVPLRPTQSNRPLKYPKAAGAYQPLSTGLARAGEVSGPTAVLMNRRLLRSPLRAFPLGQTAGVHNIIRNVALIDIVPEAPGRPWQAGIARLEVTEAGRRPLGVSATLEWVEDVGKLRDALAELYLGCPERSALLDRPRTALWLGGSGDRAWTLDVEAALVTTGAKVTIIENPQRWAKDLARRQRSDPADALLLWEPYAHKLTAVTEAWSSATNREPILLPGKDIDDAIDDAIDALEEAEAHGSESGDDDDEPPLPGDERYYIKYYGSKVGDRMIRVLDCGHDQWGSDASSRAPRALMGIEYLESARPAAIHKCSRCTKNRWRGRF